MPLHPIPIIIGTSLALISSSYAFKKFIYDPHLGPYIEAFIQTHLPRRDHRREERELIPVPIATSARTSSRDNQVELREGLRSGGSLRRRRRRISLGLDDTEGENDDERRRLLDPSTIDLDCRHLIAADIDDSPWAPQSRDAHWPDRHALPEREGKSCTSRGTDQSSPKRGASSSRDQPLGAGATQAYHGVQNGRQDESRVVPFPGDYISGSPSRPLVDLLPTPYSPSYRNSTDYPSSFSLVPDSAMSNHAISMLSLREENDDRPAEQVDPNGLRTRPMESSDIIAGPIAEPFIEANRPKASSSAHTSYLGPDSPLRLSAWTDSRTGLAMDDDESDARVRVMGGRSATSPIPAENDQALEDDVISLADSGVIEDEGQGGDDAATETFSEIGAGDWDTHSMMDEVEITSSFPLAAPPHDLHDPHPRYSAEYVQHGMGGAGTSGWNPNPVGVVSHSTPPLPAQQQQRQEGDQLAMSVMSLGESECEIVIDDIESDAGWQSDEWEFARAR